MVTDLTLAVCSGMATALAMLLWLVPRRPAWTVPPARRFVGSMVWPPRRAGAPGSLGRARGRSRRARRDDPSATVPEAMELLALALLGGGSLGAAVRHVALVLPEDRSQELSRVGLALHRGVDPAAAWADAGPAWAAAQRCLDLAAVAGVAPGPALRQAASDLRRDAIADVEVATARLGVRLVLPLGLAFLPAFVLTTVLPLVLALTRDLAW